MGRNSKNEPSIREIAAAAGVSTATVSRVLNRSCHVSAEVRDRVLAVVSNSGYAPTIATSSNLFGVMINSGEELSVAAYLNQVIRELSRHLFSAGYDLQIFSKSHFPYILRNTFRAVAVFSGEDCKFFAERDIPCVVINNHSADGYCVVTNHRESLQIAVEHLLSLGHRKIAYLHNSTSVWGSAERMDGYRETLIASGAGYDKNLCAEYSDLRYTLEEHLRRLLSFSPTALIVEGEHQGLPADHVLKQLGVRIPEELSLITFENAQGSQFMYPEHTTVCQDFDLLGKCAAETLMILAFHPEKSGSIPPVQILHNHLILRNSCARLGRNG